MPLAPAAGGGTPTGYRREIDGLRALAVVPVALFHARVPGFSGGFVGVDVFFVISGYLITLVLARSPDGGLASFYERRARRIIPALLPVLAVTFVAAWVLFIPEDFRRYAQALAATALFGSNLLFAMRSDYFAGESGFEPLIHTWSLSVEEQFYLAYPVLLLFVVKHRPRAAPLLAAALLAASLALAVALAETGPRLAFNLLPTRMWELTAGALCALLPPAARARAWPGLAGLVLIGAGMAVIGPATPAPGILFVLPVAGAALVVRYAAADTLAGRLLGWQPLVLLGLVSYGFYLWHQALLAFVFYVHFAPPPGWLVAATLGISLFLAAGSYRLIERPVREGRLLASRRSLAAICLAGLAAAAALGVAGHFERVQPRSAAEAARLGAAYAGPRRTETVVPRGRELPFLLYGDSHAGQYYPALVERAGRGALLAGSGCMALPEATNWPRGEEAARCARQYRTALRLLSERRIPVVIWAQRWERDLFETATGTRVGFTAGAGAAAFRAQLAAFRATLPDETRLVVVGNTPTAWASGPQMRGGLLRCRAYRDADCPADYPDGSAEGRGVNRILRAFAAQTPGVVYVDAAAPLCPNGRCTIVAGDRLHYSDGSHLTLHGARVVAERIAAAMRE